MSAISDIQKVYIGYYGRAADPAGLDYWVGRYNAGMTLAEIADSFAVQAESTAQYPFLAMPNLGVGVEAFITSIYQNLFNRNPDAEGFNYWKDQLLNQGKPASQMIMDMISGATGNDAKIIDNKVAVSDYFTQQFAAEGATWQDGTIADATAVLVGVNENASTVAAGKAKADALIDANVNPTPDNEVITLTTGIDIVTVGANGTVIGNTETFNPGDRITGSSGEVELFLETGNYSGTITNVDLVTVNPDGVVKVNAKNWTNIDEINIVEVDNGADFRIEQIQGSIPKVFSNDVQVGSTVTTHYDGQDLNANNRVINTAVREFNGKLVIETDANSSTKTINLEVKDDTGFQSKMEDLVGQDTETLNISGGKAGIDFAILGALDPTIKTLDARNLASNASLNVSESTQSMNIDLGAGNDKLYVGDTLVDDTVNGGAGDDRVIAEFTNTATRTPPMTGVETLEATFNAAVTFDGRKVDDLETVDLNASSGRADFNMMDSTLTTVNVLGNLSQGVEVDYDGTARATATFNILGTTSVIGNAGNNYAIQVVNADEFSLNHNGTSAVELHEGIRLDDSFSGRYTTVANITNNSLEDLEIHEARNGSVIVDGNTVQHLTVKSTNLGNIDAEGDLMEEAAALQVYTVEAAANSGVYLGDIGDDNAATDLEKVSITSGVAADVHIGSIDARGNGNAATIDQISITAGRQSHIALEDRVWLDAASVNQMTVSVASDALVDDGYDDSYQESDGLIGLQLEEQAAGSVLTVRGSGYVTGFQFFDDNFATIDASALTNDGIDVIHVNPSWATGFTFLGAAGDDYVVATGQADKLYGNGGDDTIYGEGGNDLIEGGAGHDYLYGEAGKDTILGEAGDDLIEGGDNTDLLTGGAGADVFYFDITDDAVTGKSTNAFKQDYITDFTAADDTIVLGVDDANSYKIAVIRGNDVSFINNDLLVQVRIVLRTGDYNTDGTFNASASGKDVQLLVKEDGDGFGYSTLFDEDDAFHDADMEIGLLGAANQWGSFDISDFVFSDSMFA